MRTLKLITLLLVVILINTGCQTIKQKDLSDTLGIALHRYELTTRWGKIGQIYAFLTPEQAKLAKVQPNLDNIRVTHYEVVTPPNAVSENGEEMMQSVVIRYIFIDRQVEKELLDNQLWVYNSDRREWRRNNPIPSF